MSETGGFESEYLPLPEAATRLGLREATLRRRYARHPPAPDEAYKDNLGRWLVRVPVSRDGRATGPNTGAMGRDLTETEAQLVALEAELRAVRDERDTLRGNVADLRNRVAEQSETIATFRAERDARLDEATARLNAQAEHIADLRAELARRRWPGLRRWWRRLWEGDDGG